MVAFLKKEMNCLMFSKHGHLFWTDALSNSVDQTRCSAMLLDVVLMSFGTCAPGCLGKTWPISADALDSLRWALGVFVVSGFPSR